MNVPLWTKRVKIDIGTSFNAPNSEIWLNTDSDCCVFAFEPNIHNVRALETGENVGIYIRPIRLNPEKFNKSFFCINCALSNYYGESDFYCAADDSGTSSLFKPKDFTIQEITKVPVKPLSHFLLEFPWDRFEYIEQVKIDAQSSDLNIIRGATAYLDKIVYLDVETTTNNQYDNEENPLWIKNYLEAHNFECLLWGTDATFINKKYKDIAHTINYSRL